MNETSQERPPAYNKTLVGIIAGGMLLTAALLWYFSENPETNPLLGPVTKVGVVMAALWLALPAKGESIAWEKALPIVIGAIVVVAVSRRAVIYVLPAVVIITIAIVFLRPKPKRGGRR